MLCQHWPDSMRPHPKSGEVQLAWWAFRYIGDRRVLFQSTDFLSFDLPLGCCSAHLRLFLSLTLAAVILTPFWSPMNAGQPFEKNNLPALCVAFFGHKHTDRCLLSGKAFPPPTPQHHGPEKEAEKILTTKVTNLKVPPGMPRSQPEHVSPFSHKSRNGLTTNKIITTKLQRKATNVSLMCAFTLGWPLSLSILTKWKKGSFFIKAPIAGALSAR